MNIFDWTMWIRTLGTFLIELNNMSYSFILWALHSFPTWCVRIYILLKITKLGPNFGDHKVTPTILHSVVSRGNFELFCFSNCEIIAQLATPFHSYNPPIILQTIFYQQSKDKKIRLTNYNDNQVFLIPAKTQNFIK